MYIFCFLIKSLSFISLVDVGMYAKFSDYSIFPWKIKIEMVCLQALCLLQCVLSSVT